MSISLLRLSYRDQHIISSVAPLLLMRIIFALILVARISVISVLSVYPGEDAKGAIAWNGSLTNCVLSPKALWPGHSYTSLIAYSRSTKTGPSNYVVCWKKHSSMLYSLAIREWITLM